MTEAQLHRAVAVYLRLVLRSPTIWTTIGHGGGGRVRGAMLKAKGLKAGWPDIIIIHPEFADKIVLGIELKTKKGKPSPDQLGVVRQFELANCKMVFCRSLDDVKFELEQAGII